MTTIIGVEYKDLPDDFMWKVYGLGERGAAKEIVYTQWKQYDEAITAPSLVTSVVLRTSIVPSNLTLNALM